MLDVIRASRIEGWRRQVVPGRWHFAGRAICELEIDRALVFPQIRCHAEGRRVGGDLVEPATDAVGRAIEERHALARALHRRQLHLRDAEAHDLDRGAGVCQRLTIGCAHHRRDVEGARGDARAVVGAAVPEGGASPGARRALELRDHLLAPRERDRADAAVDGVMVGIEDERPTVEAFELGVRGGHEIRGRRDGRQDHAGAGRRDAEPTRLVDDVGGAAEEEQTGGDRSEERWPMTDAPHHVLPAGAFVGADAAVAAL